jgi:phospholipid/cholesterol/gamma-HCH transport system substrate-binding protein|tara:strand:- start:334 stop:1317 length:984 start_codon:yes stop_codon:yes gene_type:complete
METRANYLLVGGFVLLFFAGLLAFVIWLAKFQFDVSFKHYELIFSSSVTGLNQGSLVRYNGVPVGEVLDISLDKTNPNNVAVLIEVQAIAPINVDTLASQEMASITGGRYILLTGGTPDSPALTATAGNRYPRIKTAPSALEQVLAGVPDAVASARALLDQVKKMLTDQNIQSINRTLSNVENFTQTLANRRSDIDSFITEAGQSMANVNDTVAGLADLVRDIRTEIGRLGITTETTLGSVDLAADKFQKTAETLTAAGQQLEGMLAENREPLRDFTNSGLYEFTALLTEARILVRSLHRVTRDVDRDPAQFLFGNRQAGYEGSGPP